MNADAKWYGGNKVNPAQGVSTDGTTLFVMRYVRPEFASLLLEPYGDSAHVSPKRAFQVIEDALAVRGVQIVRMAPMTFQGPAIALHRKDGLRSCVRASLYALVRGVLPFTAMRQHGNANAPILLYVGKNVGGVLMPMRTTGYVGDAPNWKTVKMLVGRPR